MTKKKKEPLMPRDGGPCRWCHGKYREVKRPGSPITPCVFRFSVDNVSRQLQARVFVCDECGHIEFFDVKKERDDPNA